MNRSRFMRLVALTLAIVLVFTLGALGGCKKEEPVDEPAQTTEPATETVETTEPPAEEPADASEPVVPGNEPAEMVVRLYWVEAGENSLGIERTLPYTQAIATATMKALLDGPTAAEKTTWPAISSAIPAGTELLGLTISNGIAKVDLSDTFDDGGGTFSVTARIAQVVYTLTQFPTVDSAEFYMEGVKVKMFSGEGLILDGPQTNEDYYDLLPIDA
ncbi:MAG: GerMN domain-containing protein [Coriobacteriia bacterium]|nr:GerMN domain-containing protein [Coriobacteriia bacterium]